MTGLSFSLHLLTVKRGYSHCWVECLRADYNFLELIEW